MISKTKIEFHFDFRCFRIFTDELKQIPVAATQVKQPKKTTATFTK